MNRVVARLGALVVLFLSAGGAAIAQIPEKFTNLQALPKEIERRELIDVMRNFAQGLGVRCNHCHVGENAATLEGFDFASDEKETKKVARAMMKMTREINQRLLPTTGRASTLEVRCVTCHRGLEKPQTLDQLLLATAKEKGVDEAIARYSELREKYDNQGVFDFSPRSISAAAETLAQEGDDLVGAIALMTFNADLHPKDANVQMMLGGLHRTKGDKGAAIACYERALELNPESSWAKRQLEALQSEDKSE